jgi:hypothetical protein
MPVELFLQTGLGSGSLCQQSERHRESLTARRAQRYSWCRAHPLDDAQIPLPHGLKCP